MNDAINLDSVTILNAPGVRDWAVTTEISRIEASADNVKFTFSKQDGPDRWPDTPDEPGMGPLQYTVWLFLNIGGMWFASAFIQMWFGRDGVGDGIMNFTRDWTYDANRWGPMAGHTIQRGETIGFMVTAGNERNDHPAALHERSSIVTIVVPADDASHVFDTPLDVPPAEPTPPQPPASEPPAPPVVVPVPGAPPAPPILTPTQGDELAAAIVSLVAALDDVRDGCLQLATRFDRVEADGVKVHL